MEGILTMSQKEVEHRIKVIVFLIPDFLFLQ